MRAFITRNATTISESASFKVHHVPLLISHPILAGIVSSLFHNFEEIDTFISSIYARVYNANCNHYVKRHIFHASSGSHPKLFIYQLSLVQILISLLHKF